MKKNGNKMIAIILVMMVIAGIIMNNSTKRRVIEESFEAKIIILSDDTPRAVHEVFEKVRNMNEDLELVTTNYDDENECFELFFECDHGTVVGEIYH